jgi:hypothetical protein
MTSDSPTPGLLTPGEQHMLRDHRRTAELIRAQDPLADRYCLDMDTVLRDREALQTRLEEIRAVLHDLADSPVEMHGGQPCTGCVADRLVIRSLLDDFPPSA